MTIPYSPDGKMYGTLLEIYHEKLYTIYGLIKEGRKPMNWKRWIGPLAWAWVIIIGGIMITPGGINPIVTNPALAQILGAIAVVLGITAIAVNWREISAANTTKR